MIRTFLCRPFHDIMACLESVMSQTKNPLKPTILMIIALVVTWFLYVPVHELLHVAGCLLTGGTVTELQIDAKYGGTLLARVFPFVKPASDYAGRLSGFDTHGSDLCYLATDYLPFVLSIVIGVPLIKLCTRRSRPLVFGSAVVLGLAPFYNLPGDYYEMGSIISTKAGALLTGSPTPVYPAVRSDDIFTLIHHIFSRGEELNLPTFRHKAVALSLVSVSTIIGLFLSFLTYFLGHVFSLTVVRPDATSAAVAASHEPT